MKAKTISIRGRQHFRSLQELQNDVLSEIQKLETRSHECGLTITARALNHAKNACGWEMAGNLEQAGASARGERGCRT